MTKLRIALALAVIALYPISASAQITDVFQSALKSVVGFNGWVATPHYTSPDNTAGKTQSMVLAYSVKFTPLAFGDTYHDPAEDVDVAINVTYSKIGASDFYQVEYDTIRTKTIGGAPVSNHCYKTVMAVAPGTSVPPSTTITPIACNREESRVAAHHLSLNLGYAEASNFDYQDNSGFSTSFPINGIFLEGTVQMIPWGKTGEDGLSLVFGASVPSISSIQAKSIFNGDTTLLKVSSSVSLSPDIGLGLFHRFSGEFGSFSIFADADYKFQAFRGLDYTSALDDVKLTKDILDRLPKQINADNWRLKFGVSFNVNS